jgi:hypothetical protein
MTMMYDLLEPAIASREQRYRVPLDGPADALPTFSDGEAWYNYVSGLRCLLFPIHELTSLDSRRSFHGCGPLVIRSFVVHRMRSTVHMLYLNVIDP